MRFVLAAAIVLLASPLAAQSTVTARRGATLRDVNNSRIGVVDRVNPDGSVQIIVGTRFVTIPRDKVNVTASGVVTSLTKVDVARMR